MLEILQTLNEIGASDAALYLAVGLLFWRLSRVEKVIDEHERKLDEHNNFIQREIGRHAGSAGRNGGERVK